MLRNLISLFTKKVFSLYNPIKLLAILFPKSLVNLVVEVGIRHSHQIQLKMIKENDLRKIGSLACVCSFPFDPGERVNCDHVDLTDPFY